MEDKPSMLSRIRSSFGTIKMPTWDTAKAALLISTLSFVCAGTTLYFSQLRTSYKLLAVITNYSIDGTDVKMEGDVLTFSSRAHIEMALSNGGNTPSSLLGLFLALPTSLGKVNCEEGKSPLYEANTVAWGHKGFTNIAFSITPQIVAPSTVVYVQGTIDYVGKPFDPMKGFRKSEDLNRAKFPCIGFVSMHSDGRVHTTIVPAPAYYRAGQERMVYGEDDRQHLWQPIDLEH
jgi:hypothetical protein